VYVSWRQVLDGDHRHIAVASSSNGGESFSPRAIVSNDNWQIAACPVSGAAITATTSALNVVWYTAGAEGQAGYYTATSTDGGAKFGTRFCKQRCCERNTGAAENRFRHDRRLSGGG
jgi:hypothetical protein